MDEIYATFNISKISNISSLRARTKHNDRTVFPKNADKGRSDRNHHASQDVYSNITNRINEIQKIRSDAGARKLRSSAVPAVELVLGASSSFFEGMSDSDVVEWANTQRAWAIENYKDKGQLVGFDLHLDESTPHLHLIFIPETEKVDKTTGKLLPVLSAKDFQGTKAKMNADRTSHALANEQYGLSRGKNYFELGETPPKANNRTVKQLRREMRLAEELPIEKLYKWYSSIVIDTEAIEREDYSKMIQKAQSQLKAGDRKGLLESSKKRLAIQTDQNR
jgi:hypothetical protein